jgi:capsule polysaccharide export protein KpsC/LpsZ
MLEIDPDAHFFIRVHPNMIGHRNKNLEFLLEGNFPNATVIPPESKVSSYKLLDLCDIILTFGSTVGVEACYWGKPSILAGPAFYQHLGVSQKAESHRHVLDLLSNPPLPAPRLKAIAYGLALSRFGYYFKYVEMENPFKGTFKGHDVNQVKPLYKRIALKVLSLVT